MLVVPSDSELESRLEVGESGELVEYRGMWTIGYSIINISNILELLNFCEDYNFNVVSPIINGEGRGVYYQSEFYPLHVDIAPGFDPLMNLCIEAHKRGIEVHVWIHPHTNRWAFIEHPEFRVVDQNGVPSGRGFNTNRPDCREYLVDMYMEMCTYPIDGLRMDHLYIPDSYDDYTMQAWAQSGYASKQVWERDQFTEMLRMFSEAVHEYKPDFWYSIDGGGSQWAREGIIDYLTPMIYTPNRNSFRNSVRSYVRAQYCDQIIAGPYVYTAGNTAHGQVETDEEGIALIVDLIDIAQTEGADGVCLFRYEFLRDNPEYAWALNSVFPNRTWAPVKKLTVPVYRTEWEFNQTTYRECWNIFPRRYDHPMNDQWEIHNAYEGTTLVSPLLDMDPHSAPTLELRAKNDGNNPLILSFTWKNDVGWEYPKQNENKVEFQLPPDGQFHTYGHRLDEVAGWGIKGNGDPNTARITRFNISVIDNADPSATLTLDYFKFQSDPDCQKDWLKLGPFQNTDYFSAMEMDRASIVGRPFSEFDLPPDNNNTYFTCIPPEPGQIESGLEWAEFTTTRDYIDLYDLGLGNEAESTYFYTNVISEMDMEYHLKVGADDGVVLWVNGEEVIRDDKVVQQAEVDNLTIPISLSEGINSLMLKLVQKTGEYGFYFRLTDENNGSVDDLLSYYTVLPPLPEPEPDDLVDEWITRDNNSMRFHFVISEDPDPFFSVGKYWWKIDNENPKLLAVHESNILKGYMEHELTNISNGYHTYSVRAQDGIGRNSSWGNHTYKVDRTLPKFSIPVPDRELIGVTELSQSQQKVTWNWDIVTPCCSGISHVQIWLGSSPGNSNIHKINISGESLSFTYDILTDYYNSIYLSLIPTSNAGLEGLKTSSQVPVIIDNSKPDKVSGLRYLPDIAPDGHSLISYIISWDELYSSGTKEQLDRFVVEYRSQNIMNWKQLGTTEGDKTTFSFGNPSRSERYRFRVFAVDVSGNQGPASEDILVENLAPTSVISSPMIDINETFVGMPVLFYAGNSYDPDGYVYDYYWNYGDGTFSYDEKTFHTFRKAGIFTVSLSVFDEFGAYNVTTYLINITSPPQQLANETNSNANNSAQSGDDSDVGDLPETDSGPDNSENETADSGGLITSFLSKYFPFLLLGIVCLFFLLLNFALYLRRKSSSEKEMETRSQNIDLSEMDVRSTEKLLINEFEI